MAFATGAIAEDRCPNKTCESTWTQWFANTAVLVMAEQYAASKIPMLAQINAWIGTQAMNGASVAGAWLMAKYAARFGGTAGSSQLAKND
jgi:hypothetical protein